MAHHDSRGLAVSTDSAAAAQAYRDGVDLLLSAWPGIIETLQRAVAADPEFALAHATLARAYATRMQGDEARASIARATEIVARRGTPRERAQVAIVALAVAGRGAQARESALAHVEEWPRDVAVLSMMLGAFGLFAFSGRADHDQARVDLCARLAGHFAADDWWFLTYHGWSLVENGAVGDGRDLVQRALALRPANANGIHALAHALFEAGAGDEADARIADWLPGYDRSGPLHAHLTWHQALAALERGDAARAVAIYDRHLQPTVSQAAPLNVVTDAVSLLWRLQVHGHAAAPEMWQQAKAYAEAHFPTAGSAFADAHMGLLAAATGDRQAAAKRIEALTGLIAEGRLAAGPVVPAICRGAQAFADGDYAGCVRILEPVAAEVVRIGGSGAQREIVEETLLLALMRSGDTAKARDRLDARLHRRPSARDTLWREQISV